MKDNEKKEKTEKVVEQEDKLEKQVVEEQVAEEQVAEEQEENIDEKEDKDSLFKKLFYTGIGLTVSTKEKVEKKINELVDKKKITADEGKKIIDDFVHDFDKKKDSLETEMKGFVKKTAENLKFAKRKDVENLNKRLDEIESKIEKAKEEKKEE